MSHALNVEMGRVGAAATILLLVITETLCLAYAGFALQIAPRFTVTALAAGVVSFSCRGAPVRALADRLEDMVSAGDLTALTAEHLAGMKVAKGYGAGAAPLEAHTWLDVGEQIVTAGDISSFTASPERAVRPLDRRVMRAT